MNYSTLQQYQDFSKRQTRIPCDLPPCLYRWLKAGHCESEYAPPEPELSTPTLVGSVERVQVMRERYERGEHIYHPGDSKAVAYEDIRTKQQRLFAIQKNEKRVG